MIKKNNKKKKNQRTYVLIFTPLHQTEVAG